MKFVPALIVFIGAILLSACATLDKNECLNADWELIGYEDGTRGYAATRVGDHRKACSEYGVTPDLDKYTTGRQRGLLVYCTPQSGYRVGQKTSVYRDVCPANLRGEFRKAFRYGGRIRAHRNEIRQLERIIGQSRKAIQAMEEELDLNESRIIKGAGGRRERASLVKRNRELRHLIGNEEDRISGAVYEIEQNRYIIADLVRESPYK